MVIHKSFENYEYLCGMHDTDKIVCYSIGDLDRRKFKVDIDNFPWGQFLMVNIHNQSVHLRYR